jgi:hypothetical protein
MMSAWVGGPGFGALIGNATLNLGTGPTPVQVASVDHWTAKYDSSSVGEQAHVTN